MSTIWTETMYVLSTGHLTEQTRCDLSNVRRSLTMPGGVVDVAEYEHGWFVLLALRDYHGGDEPEGNMLDIINWMRAIHRISEDTRVFAWIRFDSDGDVVPGLPTYD